MFHFRGADVRQTLASLRDQTGSPWDGILVEFVNPMNGRPVFPTLTYKAQLLRPGEQTRPFRHTASTVYTVMQGRGYTEVNGQRLAWDRNDILVGAGEYVAAARQPGDVSRSGVVFAHRRTATASHRPLPRPGTYGSR